MKTKQIHKEMITIGNLHVYCEYVLNNKPPIILIHGFVSSTYTFKHIIPLLAEKFSVVAIDLPGFGRSEKSKKFIYSFKNYAKLIVECLNFFNLNKVTIVGHSMGGQIALYMAKYFPDKLTNLILLSSSGYLEKVKNPLFFGSYLPFSRFFLERYIKRKNVRSSVENVFYNHQLITEELLKEFQIPLMDKDFYISLLRLLRHREGDFTTEQLLEIQVPTLLIWGSEDKVVPVEIGNRLVTDLPNAKLITYEKTGHLLTHERPLKLYNDIVTYTSEK
ncbi:alpha/beta fold hydrolase [Aquibacillus rhizosphaerae]|uniref:Alpha/beta hydrolase n=1 Tax=Aquibacillus rhizosphaerae TaxID=3051431 RepID=A0ABT7L4X3_9BACI|nr:alpha/beta hydrolase [Aquibacillus sp. LR5S19]MDL4840439.1 alpha/beta hydrolase [Aquibacillus sp. LR5S19]